MIEQVSVMWALADDADEGFENPLVRECETLLGAWADCEGNGDAAAGDIVRDHWDYDEAGWNEQYGADANSATNLLMIYAPASIAGVYSVEVTRSFKTSATRVSDLPKQEPQ